MIPGAIVTHGRVYTRSVPSWMIVPQLTFGGWTPTPRNESAASVRIVVAIISGSSTITVDTTLGRISEKISRVLPAPWAVAASTNSLLTTESTCPRTGRYTYGM